MHWYMLLGETNFRLSYVTQRRSQRSRYRDCLRAPMSISSYITLNRFYILVHVYHYDREMHVNVDLNQINSRMQTNILKYLLIYVLHIYACPLEFVKRLKRAYQYFLNKTAVRVCGLVQQNIIHDDIKDCYIVLPSNYRVTSINAASRCSISTYTWYLRWSLTCVLSLCIPTIRMTDNAFPARIISNDTTSRIYVAHQKKVINMRDR